MSGLKMPAVWAVTLAMLTPSASGGSLGYEARASAIAADLTGYRPAVVCENGPGWRELARRQGFDPTETWAMTPFRWSSTAHAPVPSGRAVFSPQACLYGRLFAARPAVRGAKLCLYRAVADGSTTHLWAECGSWEPKLLAVHTLTHEIVHLAGEADEAVTDCLAVQLDALVAVRLGASEHFARSLARELWDVYIRPRTTAARGCTDGGALDLFPAEQGWPTAYRSMAGPTASAAAETALTTYLGRARVG